MGNEPSPRADAPNGSEEHRAWEWIATILLGSAALVVRIIAIGQESFFIDEAITRASLARTWRHVVDVETSPPLYFFLIRGWAAVFGSSHEALRMFSALTGAIGPALVYATLRLLTCRRASAFLAGAIVAVSPLAVYHSQQARHYALLATLVALWFLALAWAARRPSPARCVAVVVALVAGFSCHYYFAFAVLGAGILLGLAYVFQPRDRVVRALLACHVIAGLLWLAYIPLLRVQTSQQHTAFIPRPAWRDFVSVYDAVFPAGPFHSMPPAAGRAFDLFLVALAGIAFVQIARARRQDDAVESWLLSRRGWLAMFLASSVLSILAPFLISLGPSSIFLKDRYTIVGLPAFALLIGWVCDSVEKRGARNAAIVCAAALWIPTSLLYLRDYWTTYQEFDWRGGIAIVEGERRDGDALVFAPGWMRTTYTDNGGHPAGLLSIGSVSPSNPGRVWLFEWEQNPDPAETATVRGLIGRDGATARIDFPHIKLWQIPGSTDSTEEQSEERF